MSASFHLDLDLGAINRMVTSSSGDVNRYIYKLGLETEMEAQQLVPVKSGKLKSSIGLSRGSMGAVEVTANRSYALAVHQGTQARTIQGNPVLRFPSKKAGGRMIVVNQVNAPATKANPFLVNALRHVITRHG